MTDANRRPQRASSTDSNVLVAELAGGLNVTSNGLNTPLGDSPVMTNCYVNESGNVQTRPGTQWLTELNDSSTIGYCGMSYKTKAGRDLIVIKDKTDIRLYQFIATENSINKSFDLVMTKTNVWPEIAANIRFDYVVTNEPNSRIIFTTGISTPVQLQFVETSGVNTLAAASNQLTIQNTLLANSSTTNLIVWANGVRYNINSVSYNINGTLTINIDTILPMGTYFVDVVNITWQWWAEAMLLEGKQLYQSRTRLDTDLNDLSVATPIDLIRTTAQIAPGAYNLIPYRTTVHGNNYSYNNSKQPLAFTQFVFSQGITYDPADNNDVVPGTSHVTFGQISGSDTLSEVHFIKAQEMPFNGDTGITGDDLLVLVDDEVALQNTNNSNPLGSDFGDSYYLRNDPPGGNPAIFYTTTDIVPNSNTTSKYLAFDSTPFVGLPFDSLVKIINTNDNDFAGTAATSNYFNALTNFIDGNLFPAFGMSEWADYSVGSFPRTCELFQGRLVFGGFPNRPLQVVFSNTFDSSEPGVFFNNFAVANEDLESTDAISVFLSSVQNDAAITGVITFGGSLFAFTRNKTIRLFASTGSVEPNDITSSVIASVGALNFACIELVDNSVIYLGANGLYQLAPSIQIGDFTIRPASAKITSLLKNINNGNVAWISYNSNDNEMLVAVTDDDSSLVATRLFYLSLFREAWAEFTLFYGRFNTSFGITVRANQVFTILSIPRQTASIGTEFDLVSYPYFYPTDVTKEITTSVTQLDFDIIVVEEQNYVTNSNIIPLGYKLAPLSVLQDIAVTANDQLLTFNKDYVKTVNSSAIEISEYPDSNATLRHHPIDSTGHYPVSIYKDNIRQTDFTLTVTTSMVRANVAFANPNNSVKRYGYTYPAIFITPLLVRQTITAPKSLKHLYVLLYNQQYTEVYDSSDLNTAVSQPVEELVGVWKREIGLRVAVKQDRGSQRSNSTQTLIDLSYDIGRYDIDAISVQSSEYGKIAYALKGLVNHFQAVYYSYSPNVWEIVAYELNTLNTQRTSLNAYD